MFSALCASSCVFPCAAQIAVLSVLPFYSEPAEGAELFPALAEDSGLAEPLFPAVMLSSPCGVFGAFVWDLSASLLQHTTPEKG